MRHAIALLATVAMLSGCRRGDEQPDAAVTEEAPVRDAEVERLAREHFAKCEEDLRGVVCPESSSLGVYLQQKRPTRFHLTLVELAAESHPGLGPFDAANRDLYVASIELLNRHLEDGGRDWLKANASRAAGQRMLDLVRTANQDFDVKPLGRSAAAIVLFAGMRTELDQLLRKRARLLDDPFSWEVLDQYLRYGGIDALPSLQAWVADSKHGIQREHAVRAVGNALTYRPIPDYAAGPGRFAGAEPLPSPVEKTKMCDWAKSLLHHGVPEVANAAAWSAGRCGGAYIDAALGALEERRGTVPADEFWIVHALSAQCEATSGPQGYAFHATAEQCSRATAWLEAAMQAKQHHPWMLLPFVTEIGRAPGQAAKAKEILASLKSHADQDVVREATTASNELEGNFDPTIRVGDVKVEGIVPPEMPPFERVRGRLERGRELRRLPRHGTRARAVSTWNATTIWSASPRRQRTSAWSTRVTWRPWRTSIPEPAILARERLGRLPRALLRSALRTRWNTLEHGAARVFATIARAG